MAEQATTQSTARKIIVNGSPCIRVYPMPITREIDGFKKTENEPLVLKPGANMVDVSLLSRAEKWMSEDIALGNIYPMERPLKSMSERDALALIELTASAEVLDHLRVGETRQRVLDAIASQLKMSSRTTAA